MKKFCESLREHTKEIFNYKKKKMKLLAKEQQKSYKIAKKRLYSQRKNYR